MISVIIPVYNTEKYLARCLDSVLQNDYRDLEILCVNNGSTDNSLAVLREYAAKDIRIKVLDLPDKGVSAARNCGLNNAKGDYIAFIDSDDWVHRSYFRTLSDILRRYNADIAVTDFCKTDKPAEDAPLDFAKLRVSVFESFGYLKNFYLKIYVWGRLYKRSAVEDCRFEEGVVRSEDRIFNTDCFCRHPSLKIALADCRLYNYFVREDSAVKTVDNINNMALTGIFLDRLRGGCAPEAISVYLSEAVKNALNLRYEFRVLRNKDACARLNSLLKDCLNAERRYKPFTARKSAMYRFFIRFPFAYRCFKIVYDPSLLRWEREAKRTVKNKR